MATRDEKLTQAQKEVLVNFMESNLEFARGKLLSTEGRLEVNNMWEILCQQLNDIGPEKSVQKWQRVWTQLKTKIKRKASSVSASQGKPGGGPPTETPLTDLEEKVMFIISKDDVCGLEGPDCVELESGQPCSYMDPTDSINAQIGNLSNEMYEVRSVLSSILEEHRNTNSILERIACALENKK